MRLFVALELDEAVRARLNRVQTGLQRLGSDVRWIPRDQLHVTLKFLGEVNDRDVSGVSAAVRFAAGRHSPFSFDVAGCGCFPPAGPVRIVWVGVGEGADPLVQVARSVDDELSKLGFPKENRPFSAHVTVGRVKEDRSGGRIRQAVQAARCEPAGQDATSVTLMSSVLSRTGPTYAAVSRAPLCGVKCE